MSDAVSQNPHQQGLPFWSHGFRPFFFSAALFAGIAIPVWVLMVTGAYTALLAAGIYTMSLFGFEYVAPVLALALMLMIGERRPLWLVLGTVVMPLIIWFLVTFALGRALP